MSEPLRRDEPSCRGGRELINTITSGFACRGCSISTRKKVLRVVQSVNLTSSIARLKMPLILFTDDGFKAIDPTQDDPMVIMVDVDNFAIMKTLVDPWSLVDILYWETFKKIRISATEIQPYGEQIVGF